MLDALTQLWINSDADLRKAITKACHALEKRLASDPENEGESRPDGRRITFEPPLAVIFQIEADAKTVTILDVRLIRKRKK